MPFANTAHSRFFHRSSALVVSLDREWLGEESRDKKDKWMPSHFRSGDLKEAVDGADGYASSSGFWYLQGPG